MPAGKRAEAKALGLKTYFTGKPCPKGHITERRVVNGHCEECGRIIAREKMRQLWATQPDVMRDIARDRSKKRPDALKEKARIREAKWHAEHREYLKAYNRVYRAANKHRLKPPRPRDKQEEAARLRRWRAENPERARANQAKVKAKRRALMAGAEGEFVAADVRRIFANQKGKCANPVCRVSLKPGYQLDHIQPISKGGSNWARNLQLLCRKCNRAKSATDPVEWAQNLGLLI